MTTGYLLDTNICVFLLRNKYGIREHIQNLPESTELYISEITLAELYYGASKSGNKERHIHDIDVIRRLCMVIPIADVMELYGDNRAKLEADGTPIDDFDLFIGSTAVRADLILVTDNTKHLARVPGVQITNWVNR